MRHGHVLLPVPGIGAEFVAMARGLVGTQALTLMAGFHQICFGSRSSIVSTITKEPYPLKTGDLYVTPAGRHCLVIGRTPNGDIAFATRGKEVIPDYNSCQTQPPDKFMAEGTLEKSVAPTELARVQTLFANYIATNGIV